MPASIKFVAVFEDSTGRRAPSTFHFENTNTFADVKAAARDVVQKMDDISDAYFVGGNIINPIEFGWWGSLTLKSAALECDVENKAYFQFVSDQNDPYSVEIPCPMNSVVDDATNLIDVTANPGLAFVDAILTNGWLDGAVNLNATDQHGNALIRLTAAFQKFRSSRKRRSAIRRMV
jgi:hypothetical protein